MPHPRCAVVVCGGQQLAIRAERHPGHAERVCGQQTALLLLGQQGRHNRASLAGGVDAPCGGGELSRSDRIGGHLPGQESSLHCDLAGALAARASDLEAVLPAALGLATASNQFTYDRDLAPFVRLAFSPAPTEQTELTTAQRAFLSALVANGHHPFDQARCLLLLAT